MSGNSDGHSRDSIRKKIVEIAPRVISGAITIIVLAVVATNFPKFVSQEKHLYLFLIRQAGWDLLGITYLTCTIWLASRQRLWKELGGLFKRRRWAYARSNRWLVAFGVILWATLGFESYFLVRARYHFWRFWGAKAYALDELDAVAKLSERGRLERAAALLGRISKSLEDTDYQNLVEYRANSIKARRTRSRLLSEANQSIRATNWNPVRDQQIYFQLAEAVRVNPQNLQAAERLESMLMTLRRDVIPKDVGRLCETQTRPSFWSLSYVDGSTWRELLPVGFQGFSCDREQQERLLQRLWAIDEVECLLTFSRQTMMPLDPYTARRLDTEELGNCEIQEAGVTNQ